jgi:hypothetical protein
MHDKRAYVSHKITAEDLRIAGGMGIRTFIANGISVPVPVNSKVIDANEYRVEGSHLAFDLNQKLYRAAMNSLWPRVSLYGNISLDSALLKGLYWSNYFKGPLLYTSERYSAEYSVVNPPKMHDGSIRKSLISWFRLFIECFLSILKRSAEKKFESNSEFGFVIGSFEQYLFARPVIDALKPWKASVLLLPGHKLTAHQVSEIRESTDCLELDRGKRIYCPPLQRLPVTSEEAWLVREVVRILPEVSSSLNWGRQIVNSGIKVFVTIAQENTPTGHLLCKLATAKGKKVVNMMNGIKLGTANDRLAEFDRWIVWDEQMKKLLVEKSNLKPDMLIVAGNLNEDKIKNHQFSNSLPLKESDLKNKIVISIISTRDRRKDKLEALDTIYEWATGKNNVIILYRSHPSEKEEDYYLPVGQGVNAILIRQSGAAAKNGLFDQLAVSSLVVNFGSTVALEAKMMGARVVTYELKEKSMLYCVDNETIFHLNKPEALLDYLQQIEHTERFTTKRESSNKFSNVSIAYADVIRSMIVQ